MPGGRPENVQDATRHHVADTVHPWPRILDQPTPELADGRFVKAFPLQFPMAVADPRQPRLRSDYSFIDAVQHLFRYRTGHFLNDGHRFVWSIFNTALREIVREKGSLVHKQAGETILTKKELQEMCDERSDLVHRMGSFGAEIPTTSMHWKHHSRNLEWIVRQMAWSPPWTDREKRKTFLEQHPRCHPDFDPRFRDQVPSIPHNAEEDVP